MSNIPKILDHLRGRNRLLNMSNIGAETKCLPCLSSDEVTPGKAGNFMAIGPRRKKLGGEVLQVLTAELDSRDGFRVRS
jgi:hypothetical protein